MARVQRVVIVGGGAAGVLVAAHLHRIAGSEVSVTVVEPRAVLADGVAYSTRHPDHLLNVRAGYLSAWPDQPSHFTEWAAAQGPAGCASFLPRMRFGAYLRAVVGDVDHVRSTVRDLWPEQGAVRVELADGSLRVADRVVLALGSSPASWPAGTIGSSAGLGAAPTLIGDPWAEGALDGIVPDPDRPVVLLGSGLTAVDVAISLRARGCRRIIATSRHGYLPHAHRDPPAPVPALGPAPAADARSLLAWVRTQAAAAGEWEPVVDALRDRVDGLWDGLAPAERGRLLRHLHRRWEVLRHRMAPQVAATITEMRERGELVVLPGGVRAVHGPAGHGPAGHGPAGHGPAGHGPAGHGLTGHAPPAAGAVEVVLADGRITAAAVINCTGPSPDVRRSGVPLVRRLLASGVAEPGPLALGLETDRDGRIPGTGGALSVVGPLRRGGVWETTAIPEIRAQAAALAVALSSDPRPLEV